MITLDSVSLTATAGKILDSISLTIEPGESLCITGSSGSGKSLLLSLLTGERKPTSGKITVDTVDITTLSPSFLKLYRRHLGVLLQESQLLPDLSIAANIALALTVRNIDKDTVARRVTHLLEMIGLIGSASDLPETVSKSKQRCIALAQAIAHEPMILIADEPCADLDPSCRECILEMLRETSDRGATVIIATHNPHSIEGFSARTVRLERGQLMQNSSAWTPHSRESSITTITPSSL